MYPIQKNLPFYQTLVFLRMCQCYPHENTTKIWFYVKLFIWTVFWNIIPIDIVALVIDSAMRGDYFVATTAFPFGLGMLVFNGSSTVFAILHETWSKLLTSVASYQRFGKPPRYDKTLKIGDVIGLSCLGSTVTAGILFVVYKEWEEEHCLKHFRITEFCGVIFPVWWPPFLEETPLKKSLLNLLQVFTLMILAMINLLTTLVFQVGAIQDLVEQKKRFKDWVEYHKHIIDLCTKLNVVCTRNLGPITFTTPIVLACLMYHSISGHYLLFVYQILYLLNTWFMCYAGQKLETVMESVGIAVYSTPWYDYNYEIRRHVPFIIVRTQIFNGIYAFPLGRLNNMFFAMMVKTGFSYINLLQQTST